MRRVDWERRLSAFIRNSGSFEWGRSDCALFVASGVEEMTGKDPAASVRGKYKSEVGALRAHRGKLGDFAGALLESVGCSEVPPLKARRGDVVAFDSVLGETLGLVDLNGEIVAMGHEGPVRLKYGQHHRAWKVD